MIGYTRDLLYNLRVAENIWSLSLKHDIQTWFVTLAGVDAACLFFFLLLLPFFLLLRDLVSLKGISGD